MRPEIIGYVVGFIDAEGSFSVSVKLQKDVVYGVRLDPVFSITQQGREPLEVIADVLNAGRIIRKPGQRHLWLLIVDRMSELTQSLIPFLDKYRDLLLAKREIYELFREIVIGLHSGMHKRPAGLKKLVTLSYSLSRLNSKAHRKRALKQILEIIDSRVAEWGEPPGDR